jgi:hypothetical protein
MKLNTLRKLALAAVGMMLAASSASALTIAYSGSFSGTPNYSTPLSFTKFDTNLGTLNSIKFEISLTATGGQFTVDNDQVGATSGTVTFGSTANVTTSDVTLRDLTDTDFEGDPVADATTSFAPLNLDGDDGDGPGVQIGGDDSFFFNALNATDTFSAFINSLYWAQYSANGAGSFTITVGANQTNSASFAGGVGFETLPSDAFGTVTITYDYDTLSEVPEPGAVMMSVLALGGIGGFVAFRRFKKPTV